MNSGYSHHWQQLFWFGRSVSSARSLAPGDKPLKRDTMAEGMAFEQWSPHPSCEAPYGHERAYWFHSIESVNVKNSSRELNGRLIET